MSRLAPRTVLLTALSMWAPAAVAQCSTQWSAMPAVPQLVHRMVEWDPDGPGPASAVVVLGGRFLSMGGIGASRIAVWDPATGVVSALGSGLDGEVHALAVGPAGELLAGGPFTTAGGAPTAGVARWDGTAWQPLGSGIAQNGSDPTVRALVVLPSGEVVAAGTFQVAGGVPAAWVARWDGSNWSAMGSSLNGPVVSLLVRSSGELLAGKLGGVWRWTGTDWVPFGTALSGLVRGLAELPNGDVVAGAKQLSIGNGGSWTQAAPDLGGAIFIDSELHSVSPLPDGDVVVGGVFVAAGGQTLHHVARWDGTAWHAFGAGTNDPVSSTLFTRTGQVLVAGTFTSVDGMAIPRLARLDSTCPASVLDLGGGCAGSGGNNVLTAQTLPWVDGTLRTRGTGLPALVVVDTGLAPIVPGFPLASVFAEAPVGCDLHLLPIVEQLHVTTTGTLDAGLFLPNTPPLVGVTFYQQLVAVEIDAGLGIVEITVSNALQLTAGDW